uniref:Microsomal glutathione S-transferase 1 n=1 Tax=Geotrypetes seraphini TaxID=260995 RepID=A0A6P8RMH2_GEOSA|nr:microsomal glutathione S-transferase 1 isoform X1 [Geotrypetes seraphini]
MATSFRAWGGFLGEDSLSKAPGGRGGARLCFAQGSHTGTVQERGSTVQAFANPEDAVHNIKDESVKKFVRFDDDVERVRRCHHNDLENIVPFVGIGLLYALSSPDLFMALIHFRIFTASRIYHTISYLIPLPQPNRGLGWMIGYGVTFSMAYTVLKTTLYL